MQHFSEQIGRRRDKGIGDGWPGGCARDHTRPEGGVEAAAAGRTCVLVLDDDPSVRLVLSRWLEWRGYAVGAYGDPGAVLAAGIVWPRVAAIISDVTMPCMDGIRFMRHLSESGMALPPCALISGNWTSEKRQAAETLGCRLFDKPVHLSAITDWLADCGQAASRVQSGSSQTEGLSTQAVLR